MLLVPLLAGVAGCFSERSFPMRPADRTPLPTIASPTLEPETTRQWLRRCHAALQPLLPREREQALVTEDLVDAAGAPIDVERHFGEPFDAQHKLFSNFFGLMYTAQSSGASPAIEKPAPPWPGFEDVWVPIHPALRLSGRLGLARDAAGRPVRTDCIVILPGLLGDLAVERTKQLALALTSRGHHVLAIELRGFGQTERFYPHVYYNFGVLETSDLLAVAAWLQDRPEVSRTGLIGFCWGANHALLAAWEEGRDDDHPSVSPRLRAHIPRFPGRRLYEAGVLAFSPCLTFETIIDQCDREWSPLVNPVLYTLQDGIRFRMRLKNHPEVSGNLRKLIDFEYARSELNYPTAVAEGLDYLRFLPYRDKPDGDKLESARMPVLIVHAANDPLAPAQDVATLVAKTSNPKVAALLLPDGGHVGFAAYARAHFYSLIVNFFDPQRGPATWYDPAGGP